ncbi:MAG: ABC transporter substrate-binding protein [Candidatus Thorarchaeota archaeon]
MRLASCTFTFVLVVIISCTSFLSYTALFMPAYIPPSNTLVLEVINEPESLDPHASVRFSDISSLYNVYETLYIYPIGNNDTGLIPLLAEDMPDISPDGISYAIKLRENVIFHDATPFNASCVKWNIERFLKIFYPNGPAYLFAEVLRGGQVLEETAALNGTSSDAFRAAFEDWRMNSNSIEIIDNYRIRFALNRAYSPFIHLLAVSGGSMISPTYVLSSPNNDSTPIGGDWREHYGVNYGDSSTYMDAHTCGTGPYLVEEWSKLNFLHLERYGNYWRSNETESSISPSESAGTIESVYIRFNPDNTGRSLNLRTGLIDLASWPLDIADEIWDNLTLSSKDPNINVSAGGLYFTLYNLGYNMGNLTVDVNSTRVITRSPFANSHFRLATSLGFDHETFVGGTFGFAVQALGPIPQGMFGHNGSLFESSYNISAAVEQWNLAMMDSIFVESLNDLNNTMKIPYPATSSGGIPVEVLVLRGLEQILAHPEANQTGLDRELQFLLEPVPWGTYFEYLAEDKLPLIHAAWNAEIAHPIEFLKAFCYHNGPYALQIGYNNTLVNNLCQSVLATIDPLEQQTYIDLIQQELANDVPYLWIQQQTEFRTWRYWLLGEGLVFNPMHSFYFYEIYKDYISAPDFVYNAQSQTVALVFLLVGLIGIFLFMAKDDFREGTLVWRKRLLGLHLIIMAYNSILIQLVEFWSSIYMTRGLYFLIFPVMSVPVFLLTFIIPAVLMYLDIKRKTDPNPKYWLLIYFILMLLLAGSQPVTIMLA